MTQQKTILQEMIRLFAKGAGKNQSERFFRLGFSLPERCVRLSISLKPDSAHSIQLPICLFDPDGEARLMKAGHRVTNEAMLFELGENQACAGGLPGPIPSGEWKLVIYKRRMCEDVSAELTVQCTLGDPQTNARPAELTFARACLDTEKRWYQGELHTHSNESTGRTSVAEVIEAAREQKLDFLALTDHFTASHWRALQAEYDGQKPLLLQSMEVSGDRGHANLHGLRRWMNPLVDDNEELTAFLGLKQRPSMNQLADDTHHQGGLFCINHPLSGEMGWRYRDFDLNKADMIEAWCLSEKDATLSYPTYYDMLLARGYRLTAVGSSDSHHPTRPGPWRLGQIRTFIYADSLSQKELLAGLKAGHAYISVDQCEMSLTACCGGRQAMMGDTLAVHGGETVEVRVDLHRHPKGNLFVYLNGALHECYYVDHSAPAAVSFRLPELSANHNAYLRVEFYEIEGALPYYGYSWRNWKTLRLISNPIYFTIGG